MTIDSCYSEATDEGNTVKVMIMGVIIIIFDAHTNSLKQVHAPTK